MILCPTPAGEKLDDKDRCPQCRGNKVVQEKKILEVHIEKGMQHGQKITFQGEADQMVSALVIRLFPRVRRFVLLCVHDGMHLYRIKCSASQSVCGLSLFDVYLDVLVPCRFTFVYAPSVVGFSKERQLFVLQVKE